MRAARLAGRVLAGRLAGRAVVVGGALLAAGFATSSPGLAVASPVAANGVWVSAGNFDFPVSIASDGVHVWVVNLDGESVTELRARTGGLVKVISGSRYRFGDVVAIASDGTHAWVANYGYGSHYSVTELSARTGRLVKVI